MRFRTPRWGAGVVCSLVLAAPAHAATTAVPAGGDLQAAINAAADGDVITLAPGATYVGNFTLTNKAGVANAITIRSAAADALLPPAGTRMTPSYAALLPKIKSPNSSSALRTAAGAHHWKLLFLEFQANQNGYGDIIALGAGDTTQTALTQVPYQITIDRVYVHGDPVMGQKRGISLNSRDTTIVNSYVSDCKAVGQDSQAISGWNGPGNFLIENNYLEAATEDFLLGGADPTIPNLVPANITFRRNYLTKKLAWRDPIVPQVTSVAASAAVTGGTLQPGTYYYKVVARMPAGQATKATSMPSTEVMATVTTTAGAVTVSWTAVAGACDYLVYGRAAGAENIYWTTTGLFFTDTGAAGTSGTPSTSPTKWAVKNVFELKNAQDVVVEGNVIENLWVAAQPGYPVVFTPRNQGGSSPWTIVQRVTFQYNLVRHAAGGVNILGTDNVAASQLTNHITVRGNVFDDITAATWGAGARVLQIGDGGDSIVFDHNTIVTTDSVVWLYGGTATAPTPITNVAYTNNMSIQGPYGIDGSNFSPGTSSINAYGPAAVVRRNVVAGASPTKYPADNFYPTPAAWQATFVNYAGHDYHLAAGGPYSGVATDGTDLGANIDWVAAETANAISGDNTLAPGVSRVQITTSSLPDGQYLASYAQTLTCTGGAAPCAWEIQGGALPSGLALDGVSGTLSGTPTAVQTATITVMAYDPTSTANCATKSFSLTIQPPPFAVTVPAPPPAQVGMAFQVAATATGAMGTPIWSVASGALPPGVGIDPSGLIAGTPNAWGTYTATVQAQDSWNTARTDSKPLTITVAPTPVTITTTALGNGTYGAMYQSLLNVTGGTGSVTWSLSAGTLPSGLLFDPSGVISGVPTSIGTYPLTLQAADTNWAADVATAALSLTIVAPAFGIAVPPAPLGMVGNPIQMAATSTGQVGTVAWSIVSGAFPPGVGIDPASGVISGTPTMWGTFNAVVQGADSWSAGRTATAPLTLVVAPLPLSVPAATLSAGNVNIGYQTTLGAVGGTGATSWVVTGGALPAGLSLAANGTIAGTPSAAGTSTFTVQATDTLWPAYTASQSFTIAIGAREVVLYASNASVVAGKWSLVADATAAGGYRIWNPDLGVAKLAAPLANPANYFEVTFQAEAGVPYHFWLRGKADKNSWANDSVFIQFSDSVDAGGAATSRIGTTDGGSVNLEDCSNCGVSGWGWQDNGWGANVFGPNIYFAQSGTHTLRVQVREDGFSIDQIVLSGARYLTVSPGALKNDTTIVPR